MKVLLLHLEDSPWEGPWADRKWDLIIDFGWAGRSIYERWGRSIGCTVLSRFDFLKGADDFRSLHSILAAGYGRLLDREGLDWWDILSTFVYPQVWDLAGILQLAHHIRGAEDVAASRRSPFVRALNHILGIEVKSFSPKEESRPLVRLQRYGRSVLNTGLQDLAGFAFDKWDPTFALRRHITPREYRSSNEPAVLLPSAYVNVSRIVAAYARILSNRHFLLVATRRSGRLIDPPPNLEMHSLVSYATPDRPRRQELQELNETWERVRKEVFGSVQVLALADHLGAFDGYPEHLRRGLAMRDAWQHVFDREKIDSVLCADEQNPYTRIPVILGGKKGLPTVYCPHGALDASMLIKRPVADVYVVWSEMARDYLSRICGLPAGKIVIGAPGNHPPLVRALPKPSGRPHPSAIVFFSEPYELYCSRVNEIYKELLPRLSSLAQRHGRRVILKLHPFESRRMRVKLLQRSLSTEDRSVIDIVDGPLSFDLLERMWFGLTVESTVAVECALQGVPCFLCKWLDSGFGYLQHYSEFGAGSVLNHPSEIEHIPRLLQAFQMTPETKEKLWRPITATELDQLLSKKESSFSNPVRRVQPQDSYTPPMGLSQG